MTALLRHAVLIHLDLSEARGWTRTTDAVAQRMDADREAIAGCLEYLWHMEQVSYAEMSGEWTLTADGWRAVHGGDA